MLLCCQNTSPQSFRHKMRIRLSTSSFSPEPHERRHAFMGFPNHPLQVKRFTVLQSPKPTSQIQPCLAGVAVLRRCKEGRRFKVPGWKNMGTSEWSISELMM